MKKIHEQQKKNNHNFFQGMKKAKIMYINFENALKNNHNFFQGMKKAKIMYIDFENALKKQS